MIDEFIKEMHTYTLSCHLNVYLRRTGMSLKTTPVIWLKKVYHKKILLRAPWVQWRHVGFAVDDFGTNLGGNFAVP